jgi:hypothetical protein
MVENKGIDDKGRRLPRAQLPRLIAAASILVFYAIGAIWFYRECTAVRSYTHGQLQSTELTCAPPDLTSASVFALLLLVAALLWPDISELTILGVSIKRRIAEVESKAAVAKDTVEQLRVALQAQQVQIDAAVSSNSTSTVNNFIDPGIWDDRKRDQLKEEVQRAAGHHGGPEPARSQYEGEDEATLRVALLSQYERLTTALGLNSVRRKGRPSRQEVEARHDQQLFIEDHLGALDSVRELRNAVAHAKDVPVIDLISGLELLDDLLTDAEHWFLERDPTE